MKEDLAQFFAKNTKTFVSIGNEGRRNHSFITSTSKQSAWEQGTDLYHSKEDVEDISQEGFIEVYHSVNTKDSALKIST
jgi:hypothetical protein